MTTFNLLVLGDAFASGVAVSLDVLSTAAAIATRLGLFAPTWRVVSASGGTVRLSNGLMLHSEALAAIEPDVACVWIVPGLAATSAKALRERLMGADVQVCARAIATHVNTGGRVAASCSAVFLLAQAGVISGLTVTTTWWLAPTLSRLTASANRGAESDRGVKVDAARMVIDDGNVTTAGAALGHTDMMLHLMRRHCGAALAHAVAKVLLIDARGAQSQFVIPAMLASGDELVSRLSEHIEVSLPNVVGVRELASKVCMTERTLARHVIAATGLPPSALIQQVRLARATALLEGSRLSVDEVAAKVGYLDATSLRRLLKKTMNATPRQLRRADAGAEGVTNK